MTWLCLAPRTSAANRSLRHMGNRAPQLEIEGNIHPGVPDVGDGRFFIQNSASLVRREGIVDRSRGSRPVALPRLTDWSSLR